MSDSWIWVSPPTRFYGTLIPSSHGPEIFIIIIIMLEGIWLHQIGVASNSFEELSKGQVLFPLMAFWVINVCIWLQSAITRCGFSIIELQSNFSKGEIEFIMNIYISDLFCVRLGSRFATAQIQNSEILITNVQSLMERLVHLNGVCRWRKSFKSLENPLWLTLWKEDWRKEFKFLSRAWLTPVFGVDFTV